MDLQGDAPRFNSVDFGIFLVLPFPDFAPAIELLLRHGPDRRLHPDLGASSRPTAFVT